jgi:hypothetical protein
MMCGFGTTSAEGPTGGASLVVVSVDVACVVAEIGAVADATRAGCVMVVVVAPNEPQPTARTRLEAPATTAVRRNAECRVRRGIVVYSLVQLALGRDESWRWWLSHEAVRVRISVPAAKDGATPRTMFVRRSENAQRQRSSTDEELSEKRSSPISGRTGFGISQVESDSKVWASRSAGTCGA